MTDRTADDEGAWARARAELARLRPEPEDERTHRLQVLRRLEVCGLVLFAVVVLLWLAVLVADGGFGNADDVPGWRSATGYSIVFAGAVALLVAFSASGPARYTRARSLPLDWLTRAERRQLLRQARGQAPVVPEDLPLARLVARVRLAQRETMASATAWLLIIAGHSIARPDVLWDTAFAVIVPALVAAFVVERRDSTRLQQFLERHPEPGGA